MANLLTVLGGMAKGFTEIEKERKKEKEQKMKYFQKMIDMGYEPTDFSRVEGALGGVAPPQMDVAPMQKAIAARQATKVPPGLMPGQLGMGAIGARGMLPARPPISTFQAPQARGIPQRPPVQVGGLRGLPEGMIDIGERAGQVGGQRYWERAPKPMGEQQAMVIELKRLGLDLAAKDLERKIRKTEADIAKGKIVKPPKISNYALGIENEIRSGGRIKDAQGAIDKINKDPKLGIPERNYLVKIIRVRERQMWQ